MINKRTALSVTLLCVLYKRGRMTIKEASAITFCSKRNIERIVAVLRKKNLIISKVGPRGYIKLAKPANEINLSEVVFAMNPEPHGDIEWKYLMAGLKTSLSRITIQDIINGAREILSN